MSYFKMTTQTTYLVTDNEQPCIECGKLTNQIDMFFEVRMCSDKCVKVWDDDMNSKLKELAENESKSDNSSWEDVF